MIFLAVVHEQKSINYIIFTVSEDFTISTNQLVFSPFSTGGTRRGLTIRTVSNTNSEASETIVLEASADNWPFVDESSTTVTINNNCLGRLLVMPHLSANEQSKRFNSYVQLDRRVGDITSDLVIDVTTRSGSAIGKDIFNINNALFPLCTHQVMLTMLRLN